MSWIIDTATPSYPVLDTIGTTITKITAPKPSSFMVVDNGYPKLTTLGTMITSLSKPKPEVLMQIDNGYPEFSYLNLIGGLTEPYPYLAGELFWFIKDGLPYKIQFPEVIKLEPEYPLSLWRISNDLPYKISFPEVVPFKYPTSLNFIKVKYKAVYKKKVVYNIGLKVDKANIPIYSFAEAFYGFAYIDSNGGLTVEGKNNIIQFWIPNPVEFNNSEVEVQLGRFTYEDNATIRLCVADEIPEGWDLSTVKYTEVGEPYGTVSYATEEIGSKYIGFMITNATITINKIKIDGVEI